MNRNHQRRRKSSRKRDRYQNDHNMRTGKGQPRQRDIVAEAGTASIDDHVSNKSGPQKSVEGWIVFVTGVHEEAQEEDIREAFADYGTINNIRVNSDSLTGFCKGYALIEYTKKSEAQDAINTLHGTEVLGKAIKVDWAFVGGGSADDVFRPNKRVRNRRR